MEFLVYSFIINSSNSIKLVTKEGKEIEITDEIAQKLVDLREDNLEEN